jgi:hypothetical protein
VDWWAKEEPPEEQEEQPLCKEEARSSWEAAAKQEPLDNNWRQVGGEWAGYVIELH